MIISKVVYHDDIRKYGSNSTGASNMLRTYGILPAAMTLIGDGLKAAVAVIIGAFFLGYDTIYVGTYIGGMASVIGHAFPIYYGFKGGKSIAAAFFMGLCTEPLVTLICLVFFIVIVAGTKYISLGSIMSLIIYPLILYRFTDVGLHILIAIFLMLLVVFLHRENIKRLISGTENRLTFSEQRKRL